MANEKVLIVEDHVVPEGLALQRKLEKAGYAVIGIAETAKHAVELAIREHPAVVLMDIELQGDRLGGTRAAKEIQRCSGAQIIFLTGVRIDDELLKEARKTTHYQFLTKPVRKTQLLASVRLAVMKKQGNASVFICYSHEDTSLANDMLKHLQELHGIGIHPFIDTQIPLGRPWREEIERALRDAQAAVCLVSIDFVRSCFIRDVELPSLFKEAVREGKRVIPIFARYVDESVLQQTGLLAFQGLNDPDDPVAEWDQAKCERECWGRLCRELSRLLNQTP